MEYVSHPNVCITVKPLFFSAFEVLLVCSVYFGGHVEDAKNVYHCVYIYIGEWGHLNIVWWPPQSMLWLQPGCDCVPVRVCRVFLLESSCVKFIPSVFEASQLRTDQSWEDCNVTALHLYRWLTERNSTHIVHSEKYNSLLCTNRALWFAVMSVPSDFT